MRDASSANPGSERNAESRKPKAAQPLTIGNSSTYGDCTITQIGTTKHQVSLCTSRRVLSTHVSSLLRPTAIGRMAGSHWPCCGACGACSIASLTKSRRAKQNGLDIYCSQYLFLPRTVRLFPFALTICSEVMTAPCWETSSNMRTLTRTAVFSPGRHHVQNDFMTQSPIAVSIFSLLYRFYRLTDQVNNIDHILIPAPTPSRRPTSLSNPTA